MLFIFTVNKVKVSNVCKRKNLKKQLFHKFPVRFCMTTVVSMKMILKYSLKRIRLSKQPFYLAIFKSVCFCSTMKKIYFIHSYKTKYIKRIFYVIRILHIFNMLFSSIPQFEKNKCSLLQCFSSCYYTV